MVRVYKDDRQKYSRGVTQVGPEFILHIGEDMFECCIHSGLLIAL